MLRSNLSSQFLQKQFGFLEISRVKPFSEPAIHRRQQLVSILILVLALPQTSQAGGGAEFPGLGLLTAGYGEGLEVLMVGM